MFKNLHNKIDMAPDESACSLILLNSSFDWSLIFFIITAFEVLRVEPKAPHMRGKNSTTELSFFLSLYCETMS